MLCAVGLGSPLPAQAAVDHEAEYQAAFDHFLAEIRIYRAGADLAQSAMVSGDYVTACSLEQSLPARLAVLEQANKTYHQKAKASGRDPKTYPAILEGDRALARFRGDIPSFNYNFCGKDPAAMLNQHLTVMKEVVLQSYSDVPSYLQSARSLYASGDLVGACSEIRLSHNALGGAELKMARLLQMNPRVHAFPEGELQNMAARFAEWTGEVVPLHSRYCGEMSDAFEAQRQQEAAQRNAQLAAEQAANEERRRQMPSQGVQASQSSAGTDDFNSRMQAWCDSIGASGMKNMAAVPPVCYGFIRK